MGLTIEGNTRLHARRCIGIIINGAPCCKQ